MDWEGADLPDAEAEGLDRTVQRTPAEIAHSIFGDLRKYRDSMRISPLEKHIMQHAEQLDLRQGVQIYRRAPTAINKKLFKLWTWPGKFPSSWTTAIPRASTGTRCTVVIPAS
jgi:hypothetical protein